MIRRFRCTDTAELFQRRKVARFGSIESVAYRKLVILDQAKSLADLGALPGNRLEALKGNRKGQHSIRINDKYRVCFVWNKGEPIEVEIVDYH
ncbi:MAG: type II toxin-antitoxin system RelE/ParE family toxin [Candidatus Binataceae bacterium]